MAKNWTFTFNNYTEFVERHIKECELFTYLIYGHEIAPTTETIHLQGYFQLAEKKRINFLLKRLPRGIHLEIARTSQAINKAYCSKGTDIVEIGTPTIAGSNLAELYNSIIACETWNDVLQIDKIHHHMTYAKEVWANKPIQKMEEIKPRKWQQKILDIIQTEPNSRTINIVYDPEGGKGKTYLCKYLTANHGAFYTSPAKGADIMHSYNNQKIILYDIPRCIDEQYVNWGCIEKLKDGIYFSGKYNSGTKYRKENAHVFIFTNSTIPEDIFSKDRIHYITI
ncbi:Rep [uncultured virus]|uniref:Rep n=1 Tax=uncultured virus TaxID=340016 RepID=A0A2K9LSU0_9VIRU|nr:Rep [uncultured virus]